MQSLKKIYAWAQMKVPLFLNCYIVKRILISFNCISEYTFNAGDFCRLIMAFANSLDPDHDRQNVGLDLDPNRLTL